MKASNSTTIAIQSISFAQNEIMKMLVAKITGCEKPSLQWF